MTFWKTRSCDSETCKCRENVDALATIVRYLLCAVQDVADSEEAKISVAKAQAISDELGWKL